MNKLPLITLSFWIMKICATTLGETAGDLFSMTLKMGYAATTVVLLSLLFLVTGFQLRSKKYHPLLYWTVILLTSTAGTTLSDFMNRTLGLGYAKGSLILIMLLGVTLGLWRRSSGTLSVTKIETFKGEFFYWTAILISNTLGTALGDFLADDSGLGFSGGAKLIGSVIAVAASAYYFTKISRVFLFWTAFILTRPLGATLGDLLTKTKEQGGANLGTLNSSLVLFSILLLGIGYTVLQQKKFQKTLL